MRLIRKNIYRAFPELDRFSDDQCRRFVAAANSSWRRRAARFIVLGVVAAIGAALTAVAVVRVTAAMQNSVRFGDALYMTVAASIATISLAPPFVAALAMRDAVLRITLRRLIRRCGACPRCAYSLLGMRVGPRNEITCPECGLTIDTDPALGELASDASGASVYSPLVAREHRTILERRGRRHRVFLKWSGLSLAAAALLLSCTAAICWRLLVVQAHEASAGRGEALGRVHKLRSALWPSGPGPDSEAEWKRFIVIAAEARTESWNTEIYERYKVPAVNRVEFYYKVLLPTTVPAAYDKTCGEGSYAASRALTLEILAHARATGVCDHLREVLFMCAPVRPAILPPDNEDFFCRDFEGTDIDQLAYFNAARMAAALATGDRADYAESLEEILAAADIVQRQGTMGDRYCSLRMQRLAWRRIAEERVLYPSSPWFEDVLAILARHAHPVPLAETLEIHRIGGLDGIQWCFSNPARIAKAQLSIGSEWAQITGRSPETVSTLNRNMDAWNSLFRSWVAQADTPQSKRSNLPVSTGLALPDQLAWWLGQLVAFRDTIERDRFRFTVDLAADLYRRRTGRFPLSLEELSSTVSDQSLLIDPMNGKPVRFVVRDASGKNGPTFEIRDDDSPAQLSDPAPSHPESK